MEATPKPKNRPGDQPLPCEAVGPVMHDLVGDDLRASWAGGSQYAPGLWLRVESIVSDLQVRKQLGVARYGQPLRAGNGRDALLDLYEELQDAAVYARQAVCEGAEGDVPLIYQTLMTMLLRVRRLRDERQH